MLFRDFAHTFWTLAPVAFSADFWFGYADAGMPGLTDVMDVAVAAH